MSATLSHRSLARRPTFDLLVERAARAMLAWSEQHAQTSRVSHDRMQLLRANEAVAARGGSYVAR